MVSARVYGMRWRMVCDSTWHETILMRQPDAAGWSSTNLITSWPPQAVAKASSVAAMVPINATQVVHDAWGLVGDSVHDWALVFCSLFLWNRVIHATQANDAVKATVKKMHPSQLHEILTIMKVTCKYLLPPA